MRSQTVILEAGRILTVTADASSHGTVHRLADSAGGAPYSPQVVAASTSTILGPFAGDRRYSINTIAGQLSYAVSVSETPRLADAALSGTTRIDEFSGVAASLQTIPAGRSHTVPAGSQVAVYEELTVEGELTIAGALRVAPWPA